MTNAIAAILQKPLLSATASDFARVCSNGIKKAGLEVLEKDTFSSGQNLMKEATGRFNKDGTLTSIAKEKLVSIMNKLNLPNNSKISEFIDALAKKGINLWEI